MTGLHEPLDRYSHRRESFLHRLDARVKLLAAVALVLLFSFTPHDFLPAPEGVSVSLVHVGGAILLVLLFVWADVPMTFILVRLAVFLPLLAAMALAGPISRGFDAQGWQMMGQMCVRGTLSFVTLLLLANTTPTDRLLAALEQLHVPSLLVSTLSFMIRYLNLTIDELARMRRARLSRTFDRRGVARWHLLAGLISMLLQRSHGRVERIEAAMAARRFSPPPTGH